MEVLSIFFQFWPSVQGVQEGRPSSTPFLRPGSFGLYLHLIVMSWLGLRTDKIS